MGTLASGFEEDALPPLVWFDPAAPPAAEVMLPPVLFIAPPADFAPAPPAAAAPPAAEVILPPVLFIAPPAAEVILPPVLFIAPPADFIALLALLVAFF